MGLRLPGIGPIRLFDSAESEVFIPAALAALVAVALLIAGILRRGLRARSNGAFALLVLLLAALASPLAAGWADWARWALASVGTVLALGVEAVTDIDDGL